MSGLPIQRHQAQSASSDSVDKFEHLNKFDSKSPYADSGNFPHIHYKTKVHPLRFRIRQALLPIIRAETAMLSSIQQKVRHPALDHYFAWTANLASHTFYVLMLPLPIWFGYGKVTRDLVYLLGYGIFVSGYIKDFCCLPRPRSPPLHRITMSGYTAKEYGFPSSHAANATAVSVLIMMRIWEHRDLFSSASALWGAWFILFVYYISLVLGRLYCGMHGFADIAIGAFIGTSLYILRSLTWRWFDALILGGPSYTLLGSVAFNYALIYFHVSPVDDCPCYDDSVAFIGVIIGLDAAQWGFCRTSLRADLTDPIHLNMVYSFAKSGIWRSGLRVVLGVVLVAGWKAVSKPILLKVLEPVYSLLTNDDDAPTTFNRIRSDTMTRERVGDVSKLMHDMRQRHPSDTVGPESTIDLTEFEDIGDHPQYFETLDKLQSQNVLFTCGVFKKRYDIAVVVRLIVYAGIPVMAILAFPVASKFMDL